MMMGEDQFRRELADLVTKAFNDYARSTRGANVVADVSRTNDFQVQVKAQNGKMLGVVIGRYKAA